MNISKQAIENSLKTLDGRAFRLLCFLAYHGEVDRNSTLTEYLKAFGLTKEEYEQDREKLEHKGLIQRGTYVAPQWHLMVLNELYRHHVVLVGQFRVIDPYSRKGTAEYLCRLSQLVIKDEFGEARKLRRPFEGLGPKTIDIFRYIQSLMTADARYMSLLNDEEYIRITSQMLNERFMNDELDESVMQMAEAGMYERNSLATEIREEMDAYRYFLYATPPSVTSKGMWAMGVMGIRAMYEGDIDKALSCFAKSMRLQPGLRGAFLSPVLNFYYGIALYKNTKRSGNEHARAELRAFRRTQILKSDDNILIRLILDNIETTVDSVTTDIEKCVAETLKRSDTPMHRSMCFIACSFFDAKMPDCGTLHTAKIMQHEMSKWLPAGHNACQELQMAYGGRPVINTLRRRAAWEMALSDITEKIAQGTDVQARKRIVYYMKDDELSSIEEQMESEDGSWVGTKLLSLTQMMSSGYESMDATDIIIASALRKKEAGVTDSEILVANLKDTGRLYVGHNYDGRALPAVIRNEHAQLVFSGKGPSVIVTTNCGVTADGEVKKHTVIRDDEYTYRIISANPFQRDIMGRLLKQTSFPATAIGSLRKTMDSLKGLVTVVDNIPDEILNSSIMSEGVIAVRVMPEQSVFSISLMATAADGGTARMVPAEGDEIVFDEVEGLTHCVKRDLDVEYANLRMISDFLAAMPSYQNNSLTECKISQEEDLLKLICYIQENQSRFFIEWPEGRALKLKGEISTSDIQISVESDTEWFTVEGEVKTNALRLSLQALLNSCRISKTDGFVKLGDDEYARMSEKLKRHLAALAALLTRGRREKRVPKFLIGALAASIKGLNVHTDDNYKVFERRTKEAFAVKTQVPQELYAQLREYQREGFEWLCRLSAWGAGACLADDMGLGKTLQALAFILHKAENGPSLVVAPKSVIPNWVSEIQRFAPSLNVVVLNTEQDRRTALNSVKAGDVVLCTYGVLCTQGGLITDRKWNVACLDEAHMIKNRNTMVSLIAMEIKAENKLALTGTPLQNNLGELWNLFQFINPGLLGTWTVFRDAFMVSGLDQRHREVLREMTAPFILRRTKQDVLNDLPEKIVHQQMVEMTDDEMRIYEEMRRMAEVKFKRYKTQEERKEARTLDISFFTELTKLRLAACSMRLVHDKWTEKSSKILELLRIVDTLMCNPDNNIVVFSQFTSFLEMVKPELNARKIDFLYLDGQTPLDKRRECVDDFQSGRCRLFLSSLKAGGLGVNLTKANYVILLDPWWNPAIENQAMDRAHRLGQKRVVSVIRLVSAQTIEEKILRMHSEKQQLADVVLEGADKNHKLTYEDIIDMVSPF